LFTPKHITAPCAFANQKFQAEPYYRLHNYLFKNQRNSKIISHYR